MNGFSERAAPRRLLRLLPLLSLLAFLSVWHLAALCTDLLATPLDTAKALAGMLFFPTSKVTLLHHVWASLCRVLAAYALAIAAGVLLGVLFGWSRRFHDYCYPIFELLRPIPPIAWIPLIIMWLGIGEPSKIAVCFIGSVVPILVNTYFGVSRLDPTYLKSAKILGAGQRALLTHVIMPGALPSILTGMKVALSSGWVCVIAAEMIAARKGLGYLIIRSMESGDMVHILVAMILIGSGNFLFSWLFSKLEGVVCPW